VEGSLEPALHRKVEEDGISEVKVVPLVLLHKKITPFPVLQYSFHVSLVVSRKSDP
jgi:hypothetical protein